jgi:DNA gyrase subunit A
MRRAMGEEDAAPAPEAEDDAGGAEATLSPERVAQMEAAEQFLITIADDGYGKRSSSFDYRTTGRGGKGLIAHDLTRGGRLVGCFPVEEGDEVLLVTDAGQLLRAGVAAVRIAARNTRGVVLIRLNEGERVVSVDRVAEAGEDEGDDEDEDGAAE